MDVSNENQVNIRQNIIPFIRMYWRSLIALFWPLILFPMILIYDSLEIRCAYVILVMAMFWMIETVPLAVTALIPIVLFPILGVLDSRQVCQCYMNDTIMVFIGGLILAIAIEHCNLHLRIALGVMRFVGCSHSRLLGGLCVVTTFISMWISNTAACAMMIPIIFAILEELEEGGFGRVFYEPKPNPENPKGAYLLKPTETTKAYLLAVAYCATFGGTGTLVGTGTNLTFKGIFEQTFPEADSISFTQWSIWALPPMAVNVFLTWFYVQVFYLGLFRTNSTEDLRISIGSSGENVAQQVMKEKYNKLGPITFHEWSVGVLFISCIILWVFRAPGFINGWASAFPNAQIKDSAPVILVSILMFMIPKNPWFINTCSKDETKRPTKISDSLITWNVINSKMPWGLVFLLGGGFAISRASNHSCLSKRIGESMSPLRDLPPFVILIIVCLFIGTLTEITSNIGMANIMLPVVAQMSIAIEHHPLYLMLPATMSCSYAFRFPVGTPPNAIVASAGHIDIKSMIVGGCFPSLFSLINLAIWFPTWGVYVYNIEGFPEWARHSNDTISKCK